MVRIGPWWRGRSCCLRPFLPPRSESAKACFWSQPAQTAKTVRPTVGASAPQHTRGVTLVELVIAVTLVAMLSVGLLFAMRVGLNAMDRSKANLMANRKVVSVERILESQISNIMPVTALCGNDRALFFEGDSDSMRLVSTFSLHEGDRGLPHILEFHVISGEDGEGVRLVVNERIYAGPSSAGSLCTGIQPATQVPQFQPIEVGPMSFVLADKIAYCRFSFKEHLIPPADGQWVTHWVRSFLPRAIRVEMAPLAANAGRLPLVTFTIPVHITRDPMASYAF